MKKNKDEGLATQILAAIFAIVILFALEAGLAYAAYQVFH